MRKGTTGSTENSIRETRIRGQENAKKTAEERQARWDFLLSLLSLFGQGKELCKIFNHVKLLEVFLKLI